MSLLDFIVEVGSGPPFPLKPWAYLFSRNDRLRRQAIWKSEGKKRMAMDTAGFVLTVVMEILLVLVILEPLWHS